MSFDEGLILSSNGTVGSEENFTENGASPENVISAVEYAVADEYSSSTDDEMPIKEKIVRLMSMDLRSSSLSSTESEGEIVYCPQYYDIVTFAENYIDDIIGEAEGIVNKHAKKLSLVLRQQPSKDKILEPRYSGDFPLIEYERPKFTTWPTIREFTIELGADKIDEYLSSFNTNEDWLYIIYYLGFKSDDTSKFYKYEAIWSLPSLEYPIAQATASVFFTIEVSNIIPLECVVYTDINQGKSLAAICKWINEIFSNSGGEVIPSNKVTFRFEGHQFMHIPGLTDFSEDWLNYILDSKIGVFKKIKF